MQPTHAHLASGHAPHLLDGRGDPLAAEVRLRRIDNLVKAISSQDDADTLVRLFAREGDFLIPRDGFVTLSRRDLASPSYRITRSWRWNEIINPWTEAHRLPIFDRGLLGDLLYAGRPVILDHLEVAADDPAHEHLAGMGSLTCAPSYDHGQAPNMVVMLRREPSAFSSADLESLLLHANLLGRAVSNLQLAHQLDEAYRRLDDEMKQAGRVQRALLPEQLPHIEGLELGASYVTCSRAGGDYYDAFPVGDGLWGLFLADVSGHGVAAAVGMAMLHTLLRSCPEPMSPPSRVLDSINRHLLTVAPRGMFATAFYGIYDSKKRLLNYALAGHPPPLLRTDSRQVTDLEMTGGLPLGVLPESTWSEKEIRLNPGEALLLYTDGFLEGTNIAGEAFGRARLAHALKLGPSRAVRLVQHVDRVYRTYCGEAHDMDDRTLLGLVAVP